MNLTKAEKVRLGTFVVVSLTVIFGSLATLAGLKMLEKHDTYLVRYKEAVSGLEVSAQVKYQGLRVGRVEAIRIAKDDPALIEVELAIDSGTKLYEGTEAMMDSSGLTGIKTINITAGDPRKSVIPPGSLLPAGESLFARITGKADNMVAKAEGIINNVGNWTSDENRRRVETLLDSINSLVINVDKTVVETREPLALALTEVGKSGASIRATADATTRTLNDVRDDLRSTLEKLALTLAEVQRILHAVDSQTVAATMKSAQSAMSSLDARLSDAQLGTTIQQLGVAMADLAKLLGELELSVMAGREDFVMSMKHVRQASEDLREFSRIIAQDPSVLLRGKETKE